MARERSILALVVHGKNRHGHTVPLQTIVMSKSGLALGFNILGKLLFVSVGSNGGKFSMRNASQDSLDVKKVVGTIVTPSQK